MTVRRTEVPLVGRPRKPALEEMGPGRDSLLLGREDGEEAGRPPRAPDPLTKNYRPRGRSIAGRPGSDRGKGGRR